ncbi:hypothetical protein EIP91_006451 [Steccherinum ochraceum]|uniref:Uncharacterized protein n=1 Tax=Steccherinum ochraceum TaxID=92696 RepID=A0A4R0R8E4_9APHY|nr:hypothetical protein EIP91_006451 [Steccherinum ochraceum]
MTTTSSTASIAEQLDRDIQEHRHAALTLSRRRNALFPAYRYPPEILAVVFQLYVASIHRPLFLFTEAQSPFEWIPGITHTCHYWREVALSTPVLWTTVPIAYCGVQVVEAFAKRSAAASLTVDTAQEMEYSHDVPVARLTSLQKVFSRIGSLRVQLPYYQYSSLFPQEPVNGSNSLRSLILGLPDLEEEDEFSRFPLADKTMIPHHTLSSLLHLNVYNYIVRWNSRFFPKSLTRLIVAGMRNKSAPISDVVEVISTLIELQELRLEDVIEPFDIAAVLPPVLSKVLLPSLAVISLHECSATTPAYYFLSHFGLPSLYKLEILASHACFSGLEESFLVSKSSPSSRS